MRRLLRIPRSLAFKVFLTVFTLLVLSAAYLTWTHIRSCRNRYRESMHVSADRIAESIRRSTRDTMLRYRPEELRRTIDTLGEQPGIVRIRIFNKKGDIVHSSDAGERDQVVDKTAEQCYACHARGRPLEHLDRRDRMREFEDADGHHVLGVISPIQSEPDCSNADCHAHPAPQAVLGVLDVNMSLDQLDHGYREGLRSLLTHSLLLVPALAIILGTFVYLRIHTRVRALIRGTREVATGNLDAVIDVGGHDEIGDLAQSFNGMTTSLRDARDELRSWSGELEEKVREKSDELARAQQEVFSADKLASIGRLAAGVAHEINNPLGGIQVFAGLLLEDLPAEGEVREKVGRIADEAARCRKIVQGLLEFARSGPPASGRVDLERVVDECLRLVEPQSLFQNVTIEREHVGPVPPVAGDVDQLRQVVLNIVMNAAEAMDGRGTLTIRVRPAAGEEGAAEAEIEILDTGPGLPETDPGRLFEPFFTTKEPGKGTGLGLAVCFGIVERHGGSLRADNLAGGGASFTIRLPARPGGEEDA